MTQSRTIKVLALSTGRGLTAIVSLVAAAVLARVLSMGDYATYRQTLLAYFFAAPLLTLALPTALYYFLPGETSRRRGVLFDNLVLLTFMGIAFAVFLLAGGNKLLAWRFGNPDLAKPLHWMALYAVFALPVNAVGACLMVQNRVIQLSVFNVVSRAVSLALIIAATLIWRTPYAPIKALVACEAGTLAVGLIMMVRAVPLDDPRPSITSMMAMVRYAVPLGLASMLGTLTLQLDKMIVASMCSPEEFAVYTNGAMEIPLVGMITGSIAAVILVDLRKAVAVEDYLAAAQLFQKAALKAACVIVPAMCFLFLSARDVVTLLYSDKYLNSMLPFRLYLCILPARVVFFGPALMALGLTKTVLWRSILELLINLVLSIVLVHAFGPLGAVAATIVTIYIWSIPYNLLHIGRGFGVAIRDVLPLTQLLWILGVATGAAVAVALCPTQMVRYAWLRLLTEGTIFVAAYLGLGYILSSEIRDTISYYWGRVLARRTS